MPRKNPEHPGRIVRHDCIEPLGLSVTEGAKVLGVTRQALNHVVNGKSEQPGNGDPAGESVWEHSRAWLRMQLAYDMAAPPPAG